MAKRPTRELYTQGGLRLAPKTAALLLGLTLTACATGAFPPAETGAPTAVERTAPAAETAGEPAGVTAAQTEENGSGEAVDCRQRHPAGLWRRHRRQSRSSTTIPRP